jgi:hypothetical protein
MYLSRKDCQYTKQYCEENVYLLAKKIKELASEVDIYVVFISNPRRLVSN